VKGHKNYDALSEAKFLEDIAQHYNIDIVTSRQLSEFAKDKGLPYPYFLQNNPKYKAGWGKYRVRGVSSAVAPVSAPSPQVDAAVSAELSAQVVPIRSARISDAARDSLIPSPDPSYVPFGFYNDLKNIIQSKIFYPVYITGLSGNGKTLMVEQICSVLKRELIRVNITKETDELDLIGSYELIDGNTIRREGPVVVAMRRGAVLLLDETDYGSERLLCLQPILEGKGFFDKKTGTFIKPEIGFNVMATANTKGKGSDDGRFIGANVLNEAFLERFAITVEQEYPNSTIESKILRKNFEALGLDDFNFIDHLVNWADQIRRTFAEQAADEVISTRRLVHIARAYSIFKNRKKAVQLCLNRFDDDTKSSFLDLYTKIDADAEAAIAKQAAIAEAAAEEQKRKAEIEERRKNDPSYVEPVVSTITSAPVTTSPVSDEIMKKLLAGNLDVSQTVSGNMFDGVFGDVRNLGAMSRKYKSVVKINNLTNGNVEVLSHGKTTPVSAKQIADAKVQKLDLLDAVVATHV